MRWLLDTNVVIDAFAGEPNAARALTLARSTGAEWVGFSAMTRLEVLGFAGLSTADDISLRALLSAFPETPITAEIIDEAIRIRKLVRIKTPDAIIAATAIVQKADVVTRNTSDFKRVSGLSVVHPESI